MRLSRWKCLPFVFTLALACNDGTGPPSITDVYVLESVNSTPPPVLIHSRDGYTTTVIWSTLSFDDAGMATLVERMLRTSPNDPPTDQTYTTRYSFRTTEENILFDYSPPCPPNALCVAPPIGTVAGSTLTLFYPGNPPFRPPSLFRLAFAPD
ncbi:MAG: hypothetical protein M3365_03795 [Gemmatimonadota bacterium]|nr:hypothetical protein [Gemmatimonadota bacterium]